MVTWVIFLTIGLVIGIAAGMFIGQLDDIKRKQREELQNKLQSAEQELVEHKRRVTEHFVKTSTLVNNMTESYKAIHNHLSVGAETLCDSPLDVGKLNITEASIIEKQVTLDEAVIAASTQAPDEVDAEAEVKVDIETKSDTEIETATNTMTSSKEDEHQSAERKLAKKIEGAGFGGVDLEETGSISALRDEHEVAVADAKDNTPPPPPHANSKIDSSAEDALVQKEGNDALTDIPNELTKKDTEQTAKKAANRIVH